MLLGTLLAVGQQIADPNFSTKVATPAYTTKHPLLVIDEAHRNFHTADGRYKPLAELLRSDGYRVEAGKTDFTKGIHADVLVISNATGAPAESDAAFTDAECAAVYDWVRKGGALLLIADHAPFGAAAAKLAEKFGVGMGKGFAMDTDEGHTEGGPSMLMYSRQNGLLGDHAITRGRSEKEHIGKVIAFTGQSLRPPAGATVLMQLGPDVFEPRDRKDTQEAAAALGYVGFERKNEPDKARIEELKKRFPAAGTAQGFAMNVGKGRVAFLGEAAMFSAQVLRFKDDTGKEQEFRMGMNVAGNDDRQFALNVMHWLSGLLK